MECVCSSFEKVAGRFCGFCQRKLEVELETVRANVYRAKQALEPTDGVRFVNRAKIRAGSSL